MSWKTATTEQMVIPGLLQQVRQLRDEVERIKLEMGEYTPAKLVMPSGRTFYYGNFRTSWPDGKRKFFPLTFNARRKSWRTQ